MPVLLNPDLVLAHTERPQLRELMLRLISANPGKRANPITWSHSSSAWSSRGRRLITGPENATPLGGSKWMIGVPTSLPVCAKASSVSARISTS